MIFFTLHTKIKSFTISASVLLCSLIILNCNFVNDSNKIQLRDGDSVKAIKRIYSSMTKIIFSELKTQDMHQQDLINSGNNFISMKSFAAKKKSNLSVANFLAVNKDFQFLKTE